MGYIHHGFYSVSLAQDGLDVRPIAVGEVLRRLVGKCLCSMVKVKVAEFFDPLQRGVPNMSLYN